MTEEEYEKFLAEVEKEIEATEEKIGQAKAPFQEELDLLYEKKESLFKECEPNLKSWARNKIKNEFKEFLRLTDEPEFYRKALAMGCFLSVLRDTKPNVYARIDDMCYGPYINIYNNELQEIVKEIMAEPQKLS